MDFVIGDMKIAIEVKGAQRIHSGHARGLNALLEEHTVEKAFIVSLESHGRKLDTRIEVLPWQIFLEALWSGDLDL